MKALHRHSPLFPLLFALLAGCSSDDGTNGGAGGESSGSGGQSNGSGGQSSADKEFPSDTSQAGVEAFLASGAYKSAPWVFDAEPRAASDGVSPHRVVRVFFNPAAIASIDEGNGEEVTIRQGSMAVKEIYDSEGTLIGTAASLKVGDARFFSNWAYYCDGPEADCGATAGAASPFYANGTNNSCSQCHGDRFAALKP